MASPLRLGTNDKAVPTIITSCCVHQGEQSTDCTNCEHTTD